MTTTSVVSVSLWGGARRRKWAIGRTGDRTVGRTESPSFIPSAARDLVREYLKPLGGKLLLAALSTPTSQRRQPVRPTALSASSSYRPFVLSPHRPRRPNRPFVLSPYRPRRPIALSASPLLLSCRPIH